jgi:hypothetical protein
MRCRALHAGAVVRLLDVGQVHARGECGNNLVTQVDAKERAACGAPEHVVHTDCHDTGLPVGVHRDDESA